MALEYYCISVASCQINLLTVYSYLGYHFAFELEFSATFQSLCTFISILWIKGWDPGGTWQRCKPLVNTLCQRYKRILNIHFVILAIFLKIKSVRVQNFHHKLTLRIFSHRKIHNLQWITTAAFMYVKNIMAVKASTSGDIHGLWLPGFPYPFRNNTIMSLATLVLWCIYNSQDISRKMENEHIPQTLISWQFEIYMQQRRGTLSVISHSLSQLQNHNTSLIINYKSWSRDSSLFLASSYNLN